MPAALRMVLAFADIATQEADLCDVLGTEAVGTPVIALLDLANELDLHIRLGPAALSDLDQWVLSGVPPIVVVSTGPLTYWAHECLHALVVVGVDEETVIVNDPILIDGGQPIPRAEFVAAWGELGQLAAVVTVSHEIAHTLTGAVAKLAERRRAL